MPDRRATSEEAIVTTKNLSKIAFLKVSQYPLLILFLALVPRTLGTELYGEYVLLLSILTISDALISFGADEICARFVPEIEVRDGASAVGRFFSSLLTVKGILDVMAGAVLFALLRYFYGGRFPESYMLVLVAAVILRDWQNSVFALLFGLNRLGTASSRDPIRRALSLTFVLLLVHYYGLLGAVLAMLTVEAILMALGFYWTRGYVRWDAMRPSVGFLAPYIRFGFVYYLCWVLMTVWQRAGNVIIDWLTKDPHQVALFDIPNQMFIITSGGILMIIGALVPMFVKLRLSDREDKLVEWSRRMVKYSSAVCVLIFAGFVLLGPGLIPVVIGKRYVDIYGNGVVLLLSCFPLAVAQMGVVFSMVYRAPARYLTALCVAVGAFLGAAAVLVPRYESMGAAIATGLSSMVLAVVMSIFFWGQMRSCVWDGVKVVAFSIAMVPFLGFRGALTSGLGAFVGFLVVYAGLMGFSKMLTIREMKEIVAALRHRQNA